MLAVHVVADEDDRRRCGGVELGDSRLAGRVGEDYDYFVQAGV